MNVATATVLPHVITKGIILTLLIKYLEDNLALKMRRKISNQSDETKMKQQTQKKIIRKQFIRKDELTLYEFPISAQLLFLLFLA